MERRVVHYVGRVQGVGFRFTTERIAAGFAVTGFVRNLADGRVELVAEGEKQELDDFLAEVASQLSENINNTTSDSLAANGEFARFEIRH